MGFFSKILKKRDKENGGGSKLDFSKSHTRKVMLAKELIQKNTSNVEHLIILAEPYPEISNQLNDILITIKYANPVANKEIDRIDNEIATKLDDLKLMLSRRTISELSVSHVIRDIKELLHERETAE